VTDTQTVIFLRDVFVVEMGLQSMAQVHSVIARLKGHVLAKGVRIFGAIRGVQFGVRIAYGHLLLLHQLVILVVPILATS
jgi:hypothetical protein